MAKSLGSSSRKAQTVFPFTCAIETKCWEFLEGRQFMWGETTQKGWLLRCKNCHSSIRAHVLNPLLVLKGNKPGGWIEQHEIPTCQVRCCMPVSRESLDDWTRNHAHVDRESIDTAHLRSSSRTCCTNCFLDSHRFHMVTSAVKKKSGIGCQEGGTCSRCWMHWSLSRTSSGLGSKQSIQCLVFIRQLRTTKYTHTKNVWYNHR